ncbi:MAG: mechanosensitive ion channel [Calditrichaceae bacterium]|nr:mechanosensitive ion channel [Calditrichaceae bacterium]
MDLKVIFDKVIMVLDYKLFELNQTPVSLSSIIMFIVLMSVILILSKMLNKFILRRIFSKLNLDASMQFTLLRVTHYVIMIIGAIIAFQFIGINLSGLAVIFGLLSVGIGFGLQNVTSNFIAGLILLFERPIQIGDRVMVGDTEGDVLDINIRSTTIRSLSNVSIIVPNSEFISSRVINWSHGDKKIRIDIDVGVSYNSDLDTVLRCLQEVAVENPKVLKNPEPDVLFRSFGDSSWNMSLRIWLPDPKYHHIIRSEINCAIVQKFRDNKIEIPFPQRDLHLRSAEQPIIIKN